MAVMRGLAALLALLLAVPAWATDYYVNNTSTSSPPGCTVGSPCRPNEVFALDLASGDNVYYLPGRYTGANYIIATNGDDDGINIICTDEMALTGGVLGCTIDFNLQQGLDGVLHGSGTLVRGFNVVRQYAERSSGLFMLGDSGGTERYERNILMDGTEHYGLLRDDGGGSVIREYYGHGSFRKCINATNGEAGNKVYLLDICRSEFSTTDQVREVCTLSYNYTGDANMLYSTMCIEGNELTPEPDVRMANDDSAWCTSTASNHCCFNENCPNASICTEGTNPYNGNYHSMSIGPATNPLNSEIKGTWFWDDNPDCTDTDNRGTVNVGQGTVEISQSDILFENVFSRSYHSTRRAFSLQPTSASPSGFSITDATGVAATSNQIDADWTQTDVEHATTLAGLGDSPYVGNGAHICYQYDESGNETTIGIYPHPMGARIRAWYNCTDQSCPRGTGHSHMKIGIPANCSASTDSCTPSEETEAHPYFDPDDALIQHAGAPPAECIRLWKGKVI